MNSARYPRVRRVRLAVRDRIRVIEWRHGIGRSKVENRTDILNFLAAVNGCRKYLEIGVRDPRVNFDRVAVRDKIGVDPSPEGRVAFALTSDEFFEALSEASRPESFDLIFVDGLHIADQVERDIANSLKYLAVGGAVVVHDCNPPSEVAQSRDYDGISVWNGTVWKAWVKLRATRSDLAMQVVDVDYGCGVIRRGNQTCIPITFGSYDELEYAALARERKALLNLVEPWDFMRAEWTARTRSRQSTHRVLSTRG